MITVAGVKPFFRWYDLWIGAYWDRQSWMLYVCPVPMFGVRIQFGRRLANPRSKP